MMLENMRKGAAKVVGSILAALLIVAMAAWGIDDYLRTGASNTTLATVGGTEITASQFDREFRNSIERLRSQLGPAFDAERARQFGIGLGTLEGLVDRQLMVLEGHRLGLVVGDHTIVDQIHNIEAFKGIGGTFDKAIFERNLRQLSMSEGEYFATMRRELTRAFLLEAISSGGAAPEVLTDTVYRYATQKRIAEVALVPRSSAGKIPEPTDDQLTEYHKSHAARYTAPEYRKVTAIVLDPTAYGKTLSIDEGSVKAEFENRLPSLKVPERRTLRQVLFDNEAKAEEAARLTKNGTAFDEAVKQASGGEAAIIDLGAVTRDDVAGVAPALADAAFSTETGKTTDAVQSPLGWHIVEVTAVAPGKTPTFEEVREQIASDLAREKAIDLLVEVANKIEDAVAGGATLGDAAAGAGQKTLALPPMDSRGKDQDGKQVASLPKDPKFLRTAFEAPEGEIGNTEDMNGGGFFILQVDSIIPPTIKPFDKVRDQVKNDWIRAEQDKIAVEKAKKLVEAANGGELAKAAKDAGFSTVTSGEVTRQGDPGGKVPPALIQDLFKLKPGAAAMGPAQDGFAVVQLKEIKEGDPSEDKAMLEQVQTGLAQAIGADLAEQFSASLKNRFTVSIDNAALDAYLDRYTSR